MTIAFAGVMGCSSSMKRGRLMLHGVRSMRLGSATMALRMSLVDDVSREFVRKDTDDGLKSIGREGGEAIRQGKGTDLRVVDTLGRLHFFFLAVRVAFFKKGDLKEAMKAKDGLKLKALRNARAKFLTKMKETGVENLTDEEAVAVLRNFVKQQTDAIAMFEKFGRTEMAEAETAEIDIIKAYLPQLADEATTRKWVEEALATSGVTNPKQVGKLVGSVMKTHKGKVDGALVNKIAAQLLASS